MVGSLVLLVIILISAIPVIAVYIWYRLAKYQFSLIWFLFALLAGAAAFFPALILQNLLNFPVSSGGRLNLFYQFFIRIASTEEVSRLLMLFVFFYASKRLSKKNTEQFPSWDTVRKGAAGGLVAGLGFALLETAAYGASNANVLLLRAFTAAPLHAACGSRVGAATVMFRSNPFQSFMRLLTAIAIHGIYNFMAALPGFPQLMAVLIALSAVASSILTIRSKWNEDPQSAP
ncbi:MAG: PrsW family intramembrane metalloprotease [Treponema sp.]|jgi:RsiW-degrading membrane proteinase PrsW (M82 family)|nr:PrsW family intramembrane metalloprotease [Treponema sp.]